MFNLTEFLGRRKVSGPPAGDSLDAFFTEDAPAPAPKRAGNPAWPFVAALTLVGVLGSAAAGVYFLKKAEPVSAAPAASVTLESDPAGAEVTSDGVAKGVTPLTMSVAPGEHTFEIVHADRRKQVKVVARAEAAVVHHVQFDLPAIAVGSAVAATTGSVKPAAKPTAPAASSTPAGPAAGWLSITSPIPLSVTEAGAVIGSTASAKIMLPAGKRQLRLVNESLGFSEMRTVQVAPGKTATLSIAVPKVAMNINAVPWAEVWVDGVRIGETPIGNHMVALGPHDIVFRHPTLGERRHTAAVSLTSPARVSVDMRKQ